MKDFSGAFSGPSLWEKVKASATKAGKEVIKKVLTLYYCCCDEDTPVWAKTVIAGALGYFIVPLDAIPDFTPVAGFTDDVGVLGTALVTVAAHVKPEHKEKAEKKVQVWFG